MRAVTAVAVVAAAAAGGALMAGAAPLERAEFTATLLASRTLDIGPAGPGIGDASIRKWRLSDRHGQPVGFGHEACRWMSETLRLCTGVYDLPTGTLVFEGMVGDGSPLAIVGGTGRYIGANGEAVRRGRVLQIILQ